MMRGDFEAAWRISDEVLRRRTASGADCHHWPRHLQYVWRGEPLAGRRVLVRCYHGLGDTLQFARFFEPLSKIAASVQVWAQPALMELLSSVSGVDRLTPLHGGVVDADFDIDIELMEIPHALRITQAMLQRAVPYISPNRPHGLSRQTMPRADRFNIGIVWRSGDWDSRRSLPPEALAPLSALSRTRLYSLQLGATERELAQLGAIDISSSDIAVAAARMRTLDLILSPDTMAAHLAGALGAPVFTLLHARCDWRWMEGRPDSPWYPSMRLFRQRRQGDWATPIAEAAAAIAQKAQAKAARRLPAGAPAAGNELTIAAFGPQRG